MQAKAHLQTRHRGARILLVEDNAINREVATALLNSASLTVKTAENGAEAVAMLRADPYDLVLMDVQMPVMDGLQATRVIRAMTGPMASNRNLIILAMTANVCGDDRQACLEAGMNDFVSKPINPENMFERVARWLPAGTSAASARRPKPAALPITTDDTALPVGLEELTGVDVQMGLHNVLDDVEVYLLLLREFDTTCVTDLQRMHDYVANGDLKSAAGLTHALKGAAGTIGLIGIQKSAIALQASLKSSGDDKLESGQLLGLLEAELAKLHAALS